ncbi:MerR family transcriptional regulator [Lachnospiraceae bacterium MD1]|uniref:MerR family transcriptional regulator n=1 Tax=Variimorphobacter saccharofermentans TaxID=2755051 RepID=A0A839K2I7_9FIRM|nr:MerR family transcriptional regulator [Variimorphobacter saccharofermentans]MBB2183830.1 MerR family transcriptional regulator [Variimorphobacter saccharofermentans]
MKNSFYIGEISDLLGIPKSTLRYWESVGLIDMKRDDMNNYRKYYPSSVYTISDLAHFRCLRMPLQDMKKLPNLSPEELADSLITLDETLDNKLEELYTAKNYINKKMDYIKEYQRLKKSQYQKESPDYENIYLFSIEDTEAWSIYIKDQYQSILLYNAEKNSIEMGLAVPTMDNHPKLWEKNNQAIYLSFVLKVAYSNPSMDDFKPHIEYLENEGYTISNIFARYLFSACDEKYYDFYKAFAEVHRCDKQY